MERVGKALVGLGEVGDVFGEGGVVDMGDERDEGYEGDVDGVSDEGDLFGIIHFRY